MSCKLKFLAVVFNSAPTGKRDHSIIWKYRTVCNAHAVKHPQKALEQTIEEKE